MKVFFNHLPQTDRYWKGSKPTVKTQQSVVCNQSNVMPSSSAYPIVFAARPDSTMLLAQSDKLLCAYSRKPMLSPYKYRSIVSKLTKKTNAQSAINFLREYKYYMPEVETEIFDMFEQQSDSGKMNFQDILLEKRPDALVRLRQKQSDVLHSADKYISLHDENFAEEMFYLRDAALLKVNDGTFSRSEVLENLKIASSRFPKYKNQIRNIYKMWYKLPRSIMDYDTFIVKYSKFSHSEIAQRLLSMAVASVEHIKPYANGGPDNLWNYVLVRMLYNQDKGDMNLAEYDELNPEIKIKENLPKYIDDVCNEIKKGNKYFESNDSYPRMLRQNVILETRWWHLPKVKTPKMSYSEKQIPSSKKGANRYRQNRMI